MTVRGRVRRLEADGGQAIVEFVIVLPFIALLLLMIIYAGVGFNWYLNVQDAAHVGARVGSVARFQDSSISSCAAAEAAAMTAMDGAGTASCAVISGTGGPGSLIRVTVRYPYDFSFGSLLATPTVMVTGSATERLE